MTLETLEDRVSPEPNTGCWLWLGAIRSDGYGEIKSGGRKHIASRYVLGLKLGRPVAPDLDTCHSCDTPLCVNPAHLFEGTRQVNIQQSVDRKRQHQAKKAHCKLGHPLSGDNLIVATWRTYNERICRVCHNAAKRRWREANKK